MRTEEDWVDIINKLEEENKKLKAALEAMTVDNARLIEERDQITARRAPLVKKHEEMRKRLQVKALKKMAQNPYASEDRLQDFDED
jgi:predicted RNase H-like nuclease (RuvC/YqgF family)